MCGITGLVGRPDPVLLMRMTEALRHRGPDGHGLLLRGPCGLGQRRLAIVDPSSPSGPLATDDGRFWLTYNGEIYGHAALRAELEDRGHRFTGQCDTEVVLRAYVEWGDAMLERLHGMFALAIWDNARQRLFVARDPLGVKPLYYALLPEGLAFASEPKALFEVPGVSRELDLQALDAYLDLLYVPPPLSMVRGIRPLPPGHALTWDRGEIVQRRYWDAPPRPRHDRSLAQWVEMLEPLVERVVVEQLEADVPVGAFLSGGLDSSTIVAIAQAARPRPLDTFSLGFGPEGASYDERGAARRVAAHLGTRHHEVEVGSSLLGEVARVVRGFDEPFGSPTALLSSALSAYARQHVKVVLAGDGGDELFGGYPRYRAMGWARAAAALPPWVQRTLRWTAGGRETATARSYRRWTRAFLTGLPLPEDERYAMWVGYRTPAERDELLSPQVRAELRRLGRVRPVEQAFLRPEHGDAIERAVYADLHGFLPENVLRTSDRMSMAHGLEIRVPFCDARLVGAMAEVPSGHRVAREAKPILRAIAARRLPSALLPRRKRGFNGPMGRWLRAKLPEIEREFLHPDQVRARGLLEPVAVSRLLGEHRAGHRDHGLAIWSLVVLEQWQRMVGEGIAGTEPTRASG